MEHPTGLSVTEHVPPDRTRGDPVVVLVHGSLDRSTSFTRVLRRLGDLHTVVYDRRGYHRSRDAVPLRTTLDGHIDDLIAVIGGRPAVVVGHSYGGTVALGAALRHDPPPTITSVAAYEPPLPWLALWSTRSTPAGGRTAGEDPGEAAEHFFRRVVGPEAWDRLSDSAREERRADGPALVAELDAIRMAEAPFDVASLRLPATYGRGERSVPHHRAGVEWLTDHTPGAELVDIAGAAHGAHLSHPDGFAAFVRRAVDRSFESATTRVGHPA
ncbi:MAG: alpha/beta fold hydrolase [Acidimicrobiales bacterium]|jgi:pimeloyl-ACP methyl ester carboxylesterase